VLITLLLSVTLFPYTTLFRSSWSEPRAVEAIAGSIPVDRCQSGRQPAAVGSGSDPPNERRVVGIRRDDAPKRADTGSVRKAVVRSEEHTSELQSRSDLVCRLL